MQGQWFARGRFRRAAAVIPAVAALGALVLQSSAGAGIPVPFPVLPGNLMVTTTIFGNDPNITAGVTQLPNGCAAVNDCATATASGNYPYVFNNDSVDGSFGVTTPLFLTEMAPDGKVLGSIEVPNSTMPGIGPNDDQMVTSYSSKSELGIYLSPDGKYVSFMGYDAPAYTADVSNDDTPGVPVANSDPGKNYRVVATLGENGQFNFTRTNAYTGDNGRAAIFNDTNNVLYMAGNASGAKKAEPGVLLGAGAQITTPSALPEVLQTPGQPTPVGTFNITELGDTADKAGKDDNFRGIGIYNNVLYYTKGSGGNGVNTLYYVNTSATPCTGGAGLPQPGATLPTTPVTTSAVTGTALTPNNMCILKGLPTNLAANNPTMFPFGFWFANPTTLYVADEGSGDNTFSATQSAYVNAVPSAQPNAGLEKWVFDATTQQWNLAYTLQNGLDLGKPYHVAHYPTGTNAATGLPWSPATDGLRNMTGRVNPDGTVTIWATSSTVSGGGDQGADPNQVYKITDQVSASAPQAGERFSTAAQPAFGVRYGGISFTPGT